MKYNQKPFGVFLADHETFGGLAIISIERQVLKTRRFENILIDFAQEMTEYISLDTFLISQHYFST